MTNVNTNPSSLIASLAVQPGQMGDVAVPAASGDSSFKALLSIGLDEAPVEESFEHEDASSKDEGQRGQDEGTPAYAVAAYVPVTNTVLADSITGERAAPVDAGADAQAAEPAAAPVAAPQDTPAKPVAATSPKASEAADKNAAPAADPAENTQVPAATEAPVAPAKAAESAQPANDNEKLRAAIARQLGNISQLLESLIKMMSGGAVVSSAAAPAAVDAKAALQMASSDLDPADQRELMKNVVAVVRDLKQALLHVAAEGGGVVIQQQEVSVSVTQVQVAATAQTQAALPEAVTALLDKLNGLLAQLMPALQAAPQAAVAADVALPVDGAQLAQLKTDIKEGIATIRDQLQQLSAQNETVYADAFSRFQAQLGIQKGAADKDATAPQGDALLKEMLALMAKTPVTVEKEVSVASAAAATVAVPAVQGDKAQLQVTTTPFVITATPTADTSSNNAGQQQGGNNQSQAPVNGIAAAGTAQSTSSADSAFARAMSLTSGRPVPEQVAVHVKMAAANGDSKITIQLDPEDLGKLDIKLNVKADGKTGIVITADNANALNLLQRDAQNLLRALNDAGLQTDGSSLSFNLRDQNNGQQGGNQQMASNYQNAQPAEEDPSLLQAVTRHYTINLNDGLDITI